MAVEDTYRLYYYPTQFSATSYKPQNPQQFGNMLYKYIYMHILPV